MAAIMALDYGMVRTGIAITDELQIIASGLTTVATTDLDDFLSDYLKENNVGLLLIGQPKTLQNKKGQVEDAIQEFIKKFTEKFPDIPIKRVDERFTSKIAFQSMIDSGMKKKKRRDKALVDEISATLILQSYLYYQ
ncbi:MAG: Holliday junction resolvase RuvX [Flavobacteriia bacterium]|nr:MAG: Holliday junction resolvase RuvX [Flavobacteriia bacterium]